MSISSRRTDARVRWVGVALGLALALGACGGQGAGAAKDQAAHVSAKSDEAAASATAALDPKAAARTKGRRLVRGGKYAAAVAMYERVGLHTDAKRVRRAGARALSRGAKRALTAGRFTSARRLALQSRRLQKTTAAATVLSAATAKIAAAKAAERERARLAAIARDARTCSSDEKRAVRDGDGTPPGCAAYAAERAAAQPTPAPSNDCDPNYTGACLKPDSSDYDCAGGSGNGPDYTGPVQSVGSDPYDLDRDGDGYACEG